MQLILTAAVAVEQRRVDALGQGGRHEQRVVRQPRQNLLTDAQGHR